MKNGIGTGHKKRAKGYRKKGRESGHGMMALGQGERKRGKGLRNIKGKASVQGKMALGPSRTKERKR